MASTCTRIFLTSSLSSFKSAVSRPTSSSSLSRSATTSFARHSASSKSVPSPLSRRFSLTRSRVELGSVASMLPLHSAVAEARMTSSLSSSFGSCRALSQGT